MLMAKDENPAVARLKKRIEGNREERQRYQAIYDKLQERTREIVDAREKMINTFWCDTCQADFTGRADKIVRKVPKKMPIAWYVGFCPVRHKCIKRITEKPNDPYYLRSYIVKRDRARHRDDLLTPNDPRFWLLFGHKHGSGAFKTIDNSNKPPHTWNP